jgi:hypothetical protein
MPHSFKLSRRIARFRAPLLAALFSVLLGCDQTDSLNPAVNADPTGTADPGLIDDGSFIGDDPFLAEEDQPTGAEVLDAQPLASISYAGGIPFGTTNQALSYYGDRYNGALLIIWPGLLLDELKYIKARGGKVVLSMTGSENYFKDANGHFSFSKWKARVDRYKSVNFNSYITDGTLVGHFMIDEPNDPTNWNGTKVSPSTVEEMARYSKSLWPNLPTIARAEPSYFGYNHRYLDAAWSQYLYRRGPVNDYISKSVADARNRGLALAVGLNIIKGGNPNGTAMTGSEIKSWGSALLSSSYPCVFISFQYNSSFLSTSSVKDAMSYLRNKAESRALRSCRGS